MKRLPATLMAIFLAATPLLASPFLDDPSLIRMRG
jgi:hypothetical protein